MNGKKSARKILTDRLWKIRVKQENILNKHLPEPHRYEYAILTAQEFHIEDGLKQTDAQLEWGRMGGHERCPIAVTNEQANRGESNEPLTKLCGEKDCPSFDRCWATQHIEAPIDIYRVPGGPTDTDPHPIFEE